LLLHICQSIYCIQLKGALPLSNVHLGIAIARIRSRHAGSWQADHAVLVVVFVHADCMLTWDRRHDAYLPSVTRSDIICIISLTVTDIATAFLQAGAMAAFLRELLLSPNCKSPVAVEADLQRCLDIHFKDMPQLVPSQPGSLPPECLQRLQPPAQPERQAAAMQ